MAGRSARSKGSGRGGRTAGKGADKGPADRSGRRAGAGERSREDPGAGAGAPPRPDVRRWIYGGLDLLFGALYAIAIWKVIPNRLPSATLHLWSLPVCALLMGAGTLAGGRRGWWLAILGGSALLLSIIVMIIRILISAAFLAGVYGSFGQAAASFSLVLVALIVELVALLPILQIKFLMTRAGRRAYGAQVAQVT